MRALIVIAGFLAIAGMASAASSSTPTTIVKSNSPVEAIAQDGGKLSWLSGNRNACNVVHLTGNNTNEVLPTPPSGGMTCHWALRPGAERLAIAAGVDAALWTLHEHGSDWVVGAEVGEKEVDFERLAHQSDGTGWWLGGLTGGGSTLVYSKADVEYVDPLACASGGSCAKKIADGGIELVSGGQKDSFNSDPALGLAVSGGRIAYIPATAVAQSGAPVSSASAAVQVDDVSNGTFISEVNPVGKPVAIGLSPNVLAVLSRVSGKTKLTWYDPSNGTKLGGIAVPKGTSPVLAMDDQIIIFKVGVYLHGLVVSSGKQHVVATTAVGAIGLSLDQGRLIWAESGQSSGRIRAVTVP